CLASHSFKVGPAIEVNADSTALELVMTKDGTALASGVSGLLDDGAGGLGPLHALEWLIDKLIERRKRLGGLPNQAVLRAGDIVYTGAIPGPILFQAADHSTTALAVVAGGQRVDLSVRKE